MWFNPGAHCWAHWYSFLRVRFSPPELQCSRAWAAQHGGAGSLAVHNGDYKTDKNCKQLAPLTPIGKNKSSKIKTRLFRSCALKLFIDDRNLASYNETGCPAAPNIPKSRLVFYLKRHKLPTSSEWQCERSVGSWRAINRFIVHFRPPASVIWVNFLRSNVLTDCPGPRRRLEIRQKAAATSSHRSSSYPKAAIWCSVSTSTTEILLNPNCLSIFTIRHTRPRNFTISFSVNADCWLLVAILTSKCSVTMHVHDLFLGLFFRSNSSKQFYLFRNQFRYCFHASTLPTKPFFLFKHCFALFILNLLFLPDGGGVAQNGHSHRAEKWRTLGWKVTYSGLKSDVRRAEKWRTGKNATLECYNSRLLYWHPSNPKCLWRNTEW